MDRRIVFILISFCLSTIAGFSSAVLNRKIEIETTITTLANYRVSLAKFFSLRGIQFPIKEGYLGTISDELESFVNADTICVKYGTEKSLDAYIGNCFQFRTPPHDGFSLSEFNTIAIKDTYMISGIQMAIFIRNPRSIYFNDGQIRIPFHLDHFNSSLIWSFLVGVLCAVSYFLWKINAARLSSERRLHDLRKISSDRLTLSLELSRHKSEPEVIDAIAKRENSIATVEAALAYEQKCTIKPFVLQHLCKEIFRGYFSTYDQNPFVIQLPETEVIIYTDQYYFYQVMANLLDNAYREAICRNGGFVKLSVIEKSRNVEVSIENPGEFRPSIIKGSGMGLKIIRRALIALNSNLNVTSKEGFVKATFILQKVERK